MIIIYHFTLFFTVFQILVSESTGLFLQKCSCNHQFQWKSSKLELSLSIVDTLSPAHPALQSPSTYYQLVNIFGRLAEHKALGYTSSYRSYAPTPLSLWLPNRWSRRLRVDHPDWKKLFHFDEVSITKTDFINRLETLSFKYPIECKMPIEVCKELNDFDITETLLRNDIFLLEKVEVIFTENYKPEQRILDVVYYLFGGREKLHIDIMESSLLEWGRQACADDPVVDFPIFESRCHSYLKRTDIRIIN